MPFLVFILNFLIGNCNKSSNGIFSSYFCIFLSQDTLFISYSLSCNETIFSTIKESIFLSLSRFTSNELFNKGLTCFSSVLISSIESTRILSSIFLFMSRLNTLYNPNLENISRSFKFKILFPFFDIKRHFLSKFSFL